MLSIQGAQRIDLQDSRIIFQNEDVWAEYEQQLYAPQIDVKMIRLENGVKRKWLKLDDWRVALISYALSPKEPPPKVD